MLNAMKGLRPISQAEELAAALKQAQAPVTFVRVEGGGHGISGAEAQDRMYKFHDKYLRGQALTVSEDPIVAPPEKGKN